MATFKKHKDASNKFYEAMADQNYKAVKSVGATLQKVGERLAGKEDVEKPGSILADFIVDLADTHAKFREAALDAASKAIRAVREDD
ncbi:MAG TPA: hypothetical protein VHJ20_14600 [Polyangia bacterium]|nr:hypothetical protein [Polyangia bacterium]